jgi:hypothetical protein
MFLQREDATITPLQTPKKNLNKENCILKFEQKMNSALKIQK